MGAKTTLGRLLAGAVGIPVLTVLTSFMINDPNAAWSVTDALIMAVGASLTTAWVAALGGYLFLRSRTAPARRTVLAWAGVGCAMLLLGFGSTALYAWEEVAAGQALPIINLFILLIPLGIIAVAVAFSRS
ncbi:MULTISPECIES: hypothetical protein [Corynebacterium]|uniref:hypothetical protein n=1 Tax=Corynebacterium TaxID=1716 RepID=UPI00254CE905|nr:MULTISPECIES: hypothetical protein [Corynebacterium]MDK6302660.1 hypothetical protein [Corynebacterium sp. UMB9976]WOH94877.1 hypothetical protein RZ943_02445 [Corynebacterium urealyticum]